MLIGVRNSAAGLRAAFARCAMQSLPKSSRVAPVSRM